MKLVRLRKGCWELSRGFSCIGLINPKYGVNIGSALRAATCFDAAFIAVQGRRAGMGAATDTTRAWKHKPLFITDDIFKVAPYDCVPVAVEIAEDAESIVNFQHPERAFYIFGPEDGFVPSEILNRCESIISIPTSVCLNLAAAVNVVLYDRQAKSKSSTKINSLYNRSGKKREVCGSGSVKVIYPPGSRSV